MKKQSFVIIRKVFYTSFFSLSIFLASIVPAYASDSDTAKAEIKYTGKQDKYLTFDVNFRNEDSKKFVVQLIDKDSQEVLYDRAFFDSSLSKTIYLLVEDTNCTVTFRIRKGRELHEQSFNINNKISMVDDMMVTKL